ncbi:hypothetical protein ACIQU6_40360 [Streptomyces sp. NPDC090442]|uniref:hypothetical protein n=1 Tax=Streptomyces sp. NPDC090442 TaxID=3365962 RepID=UPI003803D7E0
MTTPTTPRRTLQDRARRRSLVDAASGCTIEQHEHHTDIRSLTGPALIEYVNLTLDEAAMPPDGFPQAKSGGLP